MCSRQKEFYRGWRVTHHPDGPVTGLWRAEIFGIRLGCADRNRLVDMIDEKIKNFPHLQKR